MRRPWRVRALASRDEEQGCARERETAQLALLSAHGSVAGEGLATRSRKQRPSGLDLDRLVGLLRDDALLRMPPGRMILGRFGIGEFFATGSCGGKLGVIQLVPTRANRRPAVAMYRPADDGRLRPHGVLVLEVDGDRIATIDAFIDERLVGLFAAR